jgi:hypothetical protein
MLRQVRRQANRASSFGQTDRGRLSRLHGFTHGANAIRVVHRNTLFTVPTDQRSEENVTDKHGS